MDIKREYDYGYTEGTNYMVHSVPKGLYNQLKDYLRGRIFHEKKDGKYLIVTHQGIRRMLGRSGLIFPSE